MKFSLIMDFLRNRPELFLFSFLFWHFTIFSVGLSGCWPKKVKIRQTVDRKRPNHRWKVHLLKKFFRDDFNIIMEQIKIVLAFFSIFGILKSGFSGFCGKIRRIGQTRLIRNVQNTSFIKFFSLVFLVKGKSTVLLFYTELSCTV